MRRRDCAARGALDAAVTGQERQASDQRTTSDTAIGGRSSASASLADRPAASSDEGSERGGSRAQANRQQAREPVTPGRILRREYATRETRSMLAANARPVEHDEPARQPAASADGGARAGGFGQAGESRMRRGRAARAQNTSAAAKAASCPPSSDASASRKLKAPRRRRCGTKYADLLAPDPPRRRQRAKASARSWPRSQTRLPRSCGRAGGLRHMTILSLSAATKSKAPACRGLAVRPYRRTSMRVD